MAEISIARKKNWLETFADWITDWPIVRILQALSAFGILTGLTAFIIDLPESTEQRVFRAWSAVTNTAGGNSGKREALEYLNSDPWYWPIKRRASLVGIDLSTTTHNGNPVFLMGVNLSHAKLIKANFSGAEVNRAKFTYASLQGARFMGVGASKADFRKASLDGADFQDADLRGATLSNTNLDGANFSMANLEGVDLTDARLNRVNLENANLTGANLQGAAVSGTNFANVEGLEQGQLNSAWAWQDAPPLSLPERVRTIRLCVPPDTSIGLEDRPRNKPGDC